MRKEIYNSYFKLYADCIPVKGYKRSIICDFGKNTLIPIPNSLYDILINENDKKIADIVESVPTKEDREIVIEYFNFLLTKDLIIIDNDKIELGKFPDLSMEWDLPNIISNCIIDVDPAKNPNIYEPIIAELDSLNCHYIQLRFFDFVANDWLETFLKLFSGTKIRQTELIIKYDSSMSLQWFRTLQKNHMRVLNIIVHSTPPQNDLTERDQNIIYCANQIDSERCCGNIESYYFSVNDTQYRESLAFNSCLNRKIAIDKNGNIKNCPPMRESFGNINTTKLIDALSRPGFKKYWNITKDQISICKDCEFRHVCTDCRAYIENPDDIYSKPLKCGYNPYTCEWEEWSTNLLKGKAIEYYGMKDLVVNTK